MLMFWQSVLEVHSVEIDHRYNLGYRMILDDDDDDDDVYR